MPTALPRCRRARGIGPDKIAQHRYFVGVDRYPGSREPVGVGEAVNDHAPHRGAGASRFKIQAGDAAAGIGAAQLDEQDGIVSGREGVGFGAALCVAVDDDRVGDARQSGNGRA